ncbi:MAG: DNA topoisomerase IV subunit A, partial [Comamonas sp.]
LLISGSGGYGFVAKVESMCARNKGGKSFATIQDGETLCAPSVISGTNGSVELTPATHVACLSTGSTVLTYALSELKVATGGRGLQLMKLDEGDKLAGAAAYTRSVRVTGIGRGGKLKEESLEIRSLNAALGKRASKGKTTGWTFKPNGVFRNE